MARHTDSVLAVVSQRYIQPKALYKFDLEWYWRDAEQIYTAI